MNVEQEFISHLALCEKALTNATNMKNALNHIKKWLEINNLESFNLYMNGNMQNRPNLECYIYLPNAKYKSGYEGYMYIKTMKNNEKFTFRVEPEPGTDYDEEYRKLCELQREFSSRGLFTWEQFEEIVKPFIGIKTKHEAVLLLQQTLKEMSLQKDFK